MKDEGGRMNLGGFILPPSKFILCNGLRGFEGPSICKDTEPAQQSAFRLRKQVIRPIDQRAKRLMSWQDRRAATPQKPEPVVQTRCNLPDRQQSNPRCR